MARLLRRTLGVGAGSVIAGAAIVALAGAALLVLLTRQGREAERERSEDELARSYAVQSRLLNERLARQEIGALALATGIAPSIAASPSGAAGEGEALPRWLASEYDLAAVISPEGRVIAGGSRLPGDAATLASRFGSGAGLLVHDGALHLIAGREVPGSPPGRVALVGEQLDVPFAREVGDAISVELAYVIGDLSGPRVAASTLTREDAEELGLALRRLGDWNRRIAQAGRVRLELGGRGFRAMLSPLRSGEEVLGAVVTMALDDSLPELTRQARWSALVVGLLGLALGSLISVLGVRRQLRPLLDLQAELDETAPAGVRGTSHDPRDSAPATIAEAVRRRLRSEHARDVLGARARDAAAGRQTVAGGTRLVAGPGVVLALDLRRFAPTAAARHPDLALARYGGDRDLVAQAMAARGGELVAVAGHRLLGVFPRESVVDALFAAVDVGALLQRADSVFDEPVPPAVALAEGDLVRGRIGEGLRAQRVVLGRAVQETDALLREAMPGDIVFSGAVLERLSEPLAAAGIAVAEQRAVLFPQAIHRVDLAGAIAAQRTRLPALATPLAAGVVIGNRFELDSPLDETAEGRLYAARDRETGGRAEVLVLETAETVSREVSREDAEHEPSRRSLPVERLADLIERSRALPPPVVPLLDGGLVGDTLFVATTAAGDPSLGDVVGAGGPLAPGVAHELALQLAHGLTVIHRSGLLHLGLSPERVVVGVDGKLRLRWVGVESLLGDGRTHPGQEPFQAPELRAGGAASGQAADLYSWGAVVHFALLGMPRWDSGVEEWRFEAARIRALPGIAPELVEAMERCLAEDPAARPADADALIPARARGSGRESAPGA
ncbi:MAG TPA: hypothetical protein VMT85_16330 [Thermoanaerobaculia bacterium]|nr:hypothetical protein [Thermoanaerobaculia bacterium]